MAHSKSILIYHRFASLVPAGDCILPLMFIAALQGKFDVTVVMNLNFDLAGAASKFHVQLDASNVKVVVLPRQENSLSIGRQLKALSRNAHACICTSGIADFGRPAHHFICNLSTIGGKAFFDYMKNVRTRTGLRRMARKVGTWCHENIAKRFFGIRSLRKIFADPREHIYPTSRYVEDVMRDYFGPFNSTVFYPPTVFEIDARDVERDPLKVVYIGRLDQNKRIADIVSTVARARELSGQDLTLDIAGVLPPTSYADVIKRLAAQNSWVTFKGPRYGDDKRRFLLSGTFAVHAERTETFGIAITEYMKAGVIPVVPDGGGVYEIVAKPALCFHSIEESARILARLVSDTGFREEMLRHCTARAEDFSCRAYTERQSEILAKITSATPS